MGSATFKYDALGRRIEKTVNGDTTGFLYDGAQAIAELRGNTLDTVYHTGLAIDEVLARYGSSGNRTLLTDALMSVIAQANDDQSVGNFYAYSPYGQAITLGPDAGNSLQYTGRENDGTGLYYYRARYYDLVLKRFISEDPIGMRAGPNLYAYVRGNPVTRRDPTGSIDFCDEFGNCYIDQPISCMDDPSSCTNYDEPGNTAAQCFAACTILGKGLAMAISTAGASVFGKYGGKFGKFVRICVNNPAATAFGISFGTTYCALKCFSSSERETDEPML